VLRPGWSEHELLTPERFERLLSSIKDTEAVVLCIVDIFDLKGSLLRNLKQIAGENPIVIYIYDIYIYVYIYIYVSIHICMCIFIYIYVYIHINISILIYIYGHTYIYMYMNIYK
jgi:hypothetical protein